MICPSVIKFDRGNAKSLGKTRACYSVLQCPLLQALVKRIGQKTIMHHWSKITKHDPKQDSYSNYKAILSSDKICENLLCDENFILRNLCSIYQCKLYEDIL